MNRKRLALSTGVVGIALFLWHGHTREVWSKAYSDYEFGQHLAAYWETIGTGITEGDLDAKVRRLCKDEEGPEWGKDCYKRSQNYYLQNTLRSYLVGIGDGAYWLAPWFLVLAFGGVASAALGYFLPALTRGLKMVFMQWVPAIITGYVRWLREPEA